jgi:GR25 family glycosyltransferase involved in LPS biosynthesis
MKFDKIYLISVEGDTNRQQITLQRCREAGFEPTLFPATPSFQMDPEMFKYFKVTAPFPGIGCWMSHYRVLKDAYENKYDNILIFEDDVIFHEMFNQLFPLALNDLPTDWEILHLGYCCAFSPIDAWWYLYYPKCTHAYILNKAGIDKMYNINFTINIGHDNVYCDRFYDGNLKIRSYCLWQRQFDSPRRGITRLNVKFSGLVYQDHDLDTSIHRQYTKNQYWMSSAELSEKYHKYHMQPNLKILCLSDDPKVIRWFVDNILDQSGKIYVSSTTLPEDLFVDTRVVRITGDITPSFIVI